MNQMVVCTMKRTKCNQIKVYFIMKQNVSNACVSSPIFHCSQPLTNANINLSILIKFLSASFSIADIWSDMH